MPVFGTHGLDVLTLFSHEALTVNMAGYILHEHSQRIYYFLHEQSDNTHTTTTNMAATTRGPAASALPTSALWLILRSPMKLYIHYVITTLHQNSYSF